MSIIPQASKNYVGFDPRSITGCQIWIDASDSSTITKNGSTVSSWKDKANSLTFSGSATATTVNSFPCVQFNGGQTMNASNLTLSQVCTSSANFTCFLVLNSSSGTAGYSSPFSLIGTSNVSVRFMPFYNTGSTSSMFFDGGSQANPRLSGSYTSNTMQIHVFNRYSITTLQIRVNGSLNASNNFTSPVNFSNQTYTPYLSVNSAYWTGNIHEAIYFSDDVGSANIQQIEGYLARKWGLTSSLPATHPYKSIPIVTRPFLPIDITGCALWLDAADASSLTLSGSNVTQWNDKSGNGNNATGPTGTIQINQVLQNNYTTVSFAANSGFSYNIVYSSNIRAVFGVVVNAGSVTTNGANYRLIGTSTLYIGLQSGTYAGVFEFNRAGNNLLVTNGLSNFFGSTSIVSTTNSTATKGIYINGNAQNIGTDNTGSFSFNTGTANIQIANGLQPINIAELILIDGSITTSQRQQVEGYLANKWGLRSNLPSTHPFKLYPAITALFTPLQVSGCRLWLDAADASTITLSGSNVTGWTDKTGINTSVTVTGSPTYGTSSRLNNGYVVTFNGTSNSILYSGFTLAQPFTVFAVTVQRGSSPSGYSQVIGSSSGTSAVILYTQVVPTALTIYAGNNVVLSPNIQYFANITGIYSAVLNSTSSYFGFNGTGQSSLNPGTLAWNGIYLGRDFNNTYTSHDVAEIIFYNTALSTTNRQLVEGYLANKWGLKSSLPSTHPFKTISP